MRRIVERFPPIYRAFSMSSSWIADRTRAFQSSGIRRVFDLAAKLKDPINLSIGQPQFEVPAEVRRACIDAIESNKNGYALTQGMPVLREKLQAAIDKQYGHADRKVFVTSGTSGGLVLAMLSLVKMVGGVPVMVDTYPHFRLTAEAVERAITPRTKAILFNSPANPTGVTSSPEQMREIAELAAKHNIALISDEIYSRFCYDEPFASPAKWNEQTIVIDGFSKSHAVTGWRVGWVHGPAEVIETMIKLQQFTFVCAPQPMQWAAAVALDVPVDAQMADYRQKRDRLVAGLRDLYEIQQPGGAFYVFPQAPWGSGTQFVERAIANNLLIIPGNVFSARDTHFRISYAASDATIDRGLEVLRKIAQR
jgi:aspartate aminotransferase/aminotransferase